MTSRFLFSSKPSKCFRPYSEESAFLSYSSVSGECSNANSQWLDFKLHSMSYISMMSRSLPQRWEIEL